MNYSNQNGIKVQVRVNGDERGMLPARTFSTQVRALHGLADEERADDVGGPFDKNNMEAPRGLREMKVKHQFSFPSIRPYQNSSSSSRGAQRVIGQDALGR